jgi:hypothetical protein
MVPPASLALALALTASCLPQATASLSWSAGFSDDAVFQRSATKGTAVYGFASSAVTVTVTVSGGAAADASPYSVMVTPTPWVDTSGCNRTGCIDAKTPLPPAHGAFVWRAELKPQPEAGGHYTIVAADGTPSSGNGTIALERVTYGDVYFCSGQVRARPLALLPRQYRAADELARAGSPIWRCRRTLLSALTRSRLR